MPTFLKRSAGFLLALLLMIHLLPPGHAAEEGVLHSDSGFWENPLYTSSGAAPVSENSGIATAAAPVYVSLQEAAVQLREGLSKRQTSITVYVTTFYAPVGSFAPDLLNTAMEHTGVGKEGDYIRFSMTGCSYKTDYYVSDGDYYTTVTFTPHWLSTAAQEAAVDTAAAEVLAQLDLYSASEYDKICGIYDYICENVAYDHEFAADPDNTVKYTAYAALIQKKAVCQGFATLLYRLLLEVGVDCRVITGYAGDENHGWNIVKLEGVYYNVDATWDRGLTGYYRYFLCSELNFPDHARDSKYTSATFKAQYPMAQTSYFVPAQAGGSFGNGMTWSLNPDTGCLTVTGSGVIPCYRFSDPPWEAYKDNVRSIVLSEGITEVGERAFDWCKNATSLTLPESLIAIREYGFNNLRALPSVTLPPNLQILEFCAFSECPALQEIVLPDSVTTVGTSVFSNCPGLKRAVLSAGMTTIPNSMFFNDPGLREVVIPDSITSIGNTAFRDCSALRNITIPAHLTRIGTAALTGCSAMTNIFVEEGNPTYKDIDGVLYSVNGKTLVCFPAGRTGTYAVPEGTETLAYGSFGDADRMTEVTFPESLRRIEDYVFSWCYKLQRVTLGENVTFVGDSAFRGCKALKSVTFLNPNTQLDSSCFASCESLTYVKLPENLTAIPSGLMYGSSALTTLDFPAGVTKIGSSAYLDCDSLTNVTIPGHIKILDRQAFDFCNRLRTITLESGVQRLENYCIRNAPQLTKAVIPASVTYIGEENFDFCPNVTIWGEKGSAAERYALSHNIPFVDTHTHSYGADQIVPPTCVHQGYTVFACSCGLSYTSNYVDPLGHAEVLISGYAPTCTTSGLSDGMLCSRCGVETVGQTWLPATGHAWDNGVITLEPTEETEGVRTYTCTVCTVTKTEVVPVLAHTHKYTSAVTEPTCTAQGFTTYTCPCEYSYVSDYTDPLGHDEVIDSAVEPTCSEMGFSEGRHCGRCGITTVLQVPLEALGHLWDQGVVTVEPTEETEGEKIHTCTACGVTRTDVLPVLPHVHTYTTAITEPTCTEHGFTTYTCSNCGYTCTGDETLALGHAETVDPAVPPTCTSSGHTEGTHCARCAVVLLAQQTVPAKGHLWDGGTVTKEPTEETEGVRTYTCTVCGLTKTESIPVLSHTHKYTAAVTAPTCTEKGFTTYTCPCGESYVGDDTPALGHAEVTDKAVLPTCTTSGLTEGKHCSRCGAVLLAQQTVPAKGHTEVVDAAVSATCTTEGKTEGKHCSVCHAVLVAQQVIPAKGHTEVVNAAVSATCTTAGKTEGKHCPVCGTVLLAQQTVPAKGHTEVVDKAAAATCTTEGKTAGKHCSVCNVVLVPQQSVAAKGHTWDSGVVTKQPTETAEGEKKFTCTACGETKLQSVPVLSHTHKYEKTVTAPTCTEEGYTTYTCRCGDSYKGDYVSAKGHTEVVDAAISATCTTSGKTEGKHCSVCHAVLVAQQVIPAKGHTVVTDKAVAATCTESGLTEGKRCSVCDTVLSVQQTIPATGHTYDGDRDADCNVCGALRDVEKPTSPVSGRVKNSRGAKVRLGSYETETKDAYTFSEVEAGTYTLTVREGGCLTYTVKEITVGESPVTLPEITLVRGDTNGDDMINIVDMSVFRSNFGKTAATITNAYTDTNGDKMVNIVDMSVFRTNFGKTAAKDCTITY